MDFGTPITSLEMAKSFYVANGCSYYYMAREYPKRYEEYRGLNISEDIEFQWKTEHFLDLYNELMDETNGENVVYLHGSMDDLALAIDTEDAYEKMLSATRKAAEIVPDGFRIVIAETINGRQEHQYRSGLIFRSFDRARYDHALEYAEISLSMADRDNNPAAFALVRRTPERIKNAIDNCNLIRRKLGI